MEKLKITSIRLQIAVLILVILTPCAMVLCAVKGAWAELLHMPQYIPLDVAYINGVGLLAMIALGSIKPAAFMASVWFLYKLLGLYREGIIFAAANVAAIRKIG